MHLLVKSHIGEVVFASVSGETEKNGKRTLVDPLENSGPTP